jgi:glycosyltransferase involved in cell wall biosynthesis
LRVSGERVIWTPFMVDAKFFSPAQITNHQNPKQICAVGLEFRDYPTLMRAVDGLDVQVVIAAASPWSKRADTTQDQKIPANVTIKKFSQFELRQVYADSAFLVMPLFNVNFQAGVTAILEAMAMERAVICSRTPGQTDVIVENETGLYVPPGDANALRAAIQDLLAQPERAQKMGRAGRTRIENEMSLDRYVEQLKKYF